MSQPKLPEFSANQTAYVRNNHNLKDKVTVIETKKHVHTQYLVDSVTRDGTRLWTDGKPWLRTVHDTKSSEWWTYLIEHSDGVRHWVNEQQLSKDPI